MNETSKLLFAIQQTENIIKLMQGNEYEKFFISQLSPVLYDLKRQLQISRGQSKNWHT